LKRTDDQGLIIKPNGTLKVDCFVDADFAGLYGQEPDESPNAARSRTGYILKMGGCPLIWKSQLQTTIALSTLEAEYVALSSAMRVVIPMRGLIAEIASGLKLKQSVQATIHAEVFEDNNGALLLATKQRLTSRNKYFLVKLHFFWSHVTNGEVAIQKIPTEDQEADYLTKGLPRETFERLRRKTQNW
jgi:hypothetical protein